MSQEQQHELPPEEGGGRLNWLLAVLVLAVALVMGIVLAAGVQSSGVSTQPSASSDPGSGSDMADKGEIADLLAHGGRTVRPLAPVPLPVAPVNPPPIVSQRTPNSPSAFEQWAEQKYMKAFESPEVVAAFHSTTLEVPQARSQGGGSNFSPGESGSSGAAQVHPAPSPYTITAGNVIPALLVSEIDSDLPGPIVAQVREGVFDTATCRYMLIPQGSKLIGSYQNASAYDSSASRSPGIA